MATEPTTPNNPQNPQENSQEEAPLIPPGYLLALAGAGLVIALGVLFTQPSFTVVGWGGLGITVLSLLAWALLAPEQLQEVLKGRALRFGGTAVVVTVIFLAALVMVYIVVRQQGWRQDFSQSDNFSLTPQAAELIDTLTQDPTTPNIRIVGFYTSSQAGQRDRAAVLMDDVVNASNGRISYEFIDPNREPLVAESYEVRAGQYVVVPLDEAGEPLRDQAEVVPTLTQQALTDALVSVSASGDFRAYFLRVQDGVDMEDSGPLGGSVMATELQERFNWTVENVRLLDLINPESGIQLAPNTPDGEVLVIPGGSEPLPEDQLTIITDYLENGGDVTLFAGVNLEGEEALATGDALSQYLWENFGLRINNDLVIDPINSVQSAFQIDVHDFGDHPIVSDYTDQDSLLLSATHSIDIAEELPANVTVTELARTGEESYTRTDLVLGEQLAQEDLAPAEDEPTGPQVVAAAAENSETGARVVVYGSEALLYNQYRQLDAFGIRNSNAALGSLFWVTEYSEFFQNIPTLQTEPSPADQPLLATDVEVRTIGFVVMGIVPFGVLLLGAAVWWTQRERDMRAIEATTETTESPAA